MTAIETRHIDPTQQQVDTLVVAAQDFAGPVMMINLLVALQTSGLIATDPWSVVN